MFRGKDPEQITHLSCDRPAEIADLDRRIGLQIQALEQEIEPELIGQRIAELREAKEAAEIDLRALTPAAADSTPPEAREALLARLPDLTQALHDAPPQLKRQVFDAFNLKITYDKTSRRIEISATISQAVAQALQNAKDLPEEAFGVAQTNIAGARFVARGDARIVQQHRGLAGVSRA